MATSAERELQSVKDDITRLKRDLGSLVEALGGSGKDAVDSAAKRLREQARDRARQMERGVEHVRDAGHHAAERAGETVREHPVVTVAAVLGLGILTAALLSRRR